MFTFLMLVFPKLSGKQIHYFSTGFDIHISLLLLNFTGFNLAKDYSVQVSITSLIYLVIF